MKLKTAALLFMITALVAAAALWGVQKNRAQANEPGQHDEFAKCLTEKGAMMYGAYWCQHCKNQKEMFGNSWKYVEYIECSLPNKAGRTEFCRKAGINGYPTWEFADGSRVSSEMSFEQLAGKSGCGLDEVQ
ncbi:TPA: hypothetical protein HA231_04355 [Candidatus Woesearchaeota archaeon]|nr:hypothetical protein [Candidatus Woesearchaeota archaeon]